MYQSNKHSVYRLLLFFAAVLVIWLTPVCVQADPPDTSSQESELEASESVQIPGFDQSTYGYVYTGKDAVVKVPAGITELNHYIFYKNNTVQAVIIPASVMYVSDYAFYKCNNLKYICFMSASTRVTDRFLNGAPSLVNISAPKRSAVYTKCVKDNIPVTSSKNPCFSKKTVYLLPGDSQKMPLFNSLEAVYSTSNKKIVTVDKKGTIHAKRKAR